MQFFFNLLKQRSCMAWWGFGLGRNSKHVTTPVFPNSSLSFLFQYVFNNLFRQALLVLNSENNSGFISWSSRPSKLGLFSAQSKENSYIVSNFQDLLIKLLVFRWTCWVSIFNYTRGQLHILWIWGPNVFKFKVNVSAVFKFKVEGLDSLVKFTPLPLSPP